MADLKIGDAFSPPTQHPMRIVEVKRDKRRGTLYRLEWKDDPRFPGKTFNLWCTQAQMDEHFGLPN